MCPRSSWVATPARSPLLARPLSRRTVTRWSWELGALVPAAAAVLAAPGAATTALVLTELGTLLAVLAVVHADRALAGGAVVATMLWPP